VTSDPNLRGTVVGLKARFTAARTPPCVAFLVVMIACGEPTSSSGGTTTGASGSGGSSSTSAATEPDETGADTEGDVVPFSGDLRVMTFNILCSICDGTFDPWEDRVPWIGDTIVRHDPDLIGLQELVFDSEMEQVLAVAPGYAAIAYNAGQRSAYPDATILYRESMFEPMEHGFYWLSPTPDVPRSTGFIDTFQLARLVTWAVFRRVDDDAQLYFATTHFDNNAPSQTLSAPLVLDRTAPFAQTLPVVMVGDFNARPDSEAYGILTGAGGFSDAFQSAEAWSVDSNEEPAPRYDPSVLIDHIFTAGAEWSTTTWSADLWSYGDNDLPISDHWAVTADLQLP